MTRQIVVRQNQQQILPVLWLGTESELTYTVRLAGEGAQITFLLLLLGHDSQALNLNIHIYHDQPHTQSKLIVKGALADRSKVDFNGLVSIARGARGSDAWLAAHLLLLSPGASGRAVPNLEISENDVKAGHAATVGRLSDTELFYLMSRGLDRDTATRLIVSGFVQSLLTDFPPALARRATRHFVL